MSAPAMAALAVMQRTLATPPRLFGDLALYRPDPAVTRLASTGHAALGIGAAVYIADALATEAMLGAHPRFVVKTANGRIFRLLPDSGTLSVEQGGARGDGTSDDQPAIQATLDYAAKVGAREIRFDAAHYRIHCPRRTAPAGDTRAEDGHPLVVRASVSLRGCAGERTVLDFRGEDGADPETSWQTVATSAANAAPAVWRGGGIFLQGDVSDPAPGPLKIARFEMHRLVLRGNRKRTGAYSWPASSVTGDGWDVTDKALWLQDCRVGRIVCTDTDMIGWKGEIFYLAGAEDAVGSLHLERCRFAGTNAGAFTPSVDCDLIAIDCEFGEASQAHEDVGKSRAVYRGCTWFDCESSGLGSGATEGIAHNNRLYPTRRTDSCVPQTVLENCTFRDAGYVRILSWVRGTVTAIDTPVLIDGSHCPALRDTDIAIDSWIDRRADFVAVQFIGPATLTDAVPSAPVGTYKQPPRNVAVRVRQRRTALAETLGRQSHGVSWSGHIHRSCRLTVEGDFGHARTPNGGAAPVSMPLVRYTGGEATSAYVPHGWYTIPAIQASGVLAPAGPVQVIMVPDERTVAMTLPAAPAGGTDCGYAEGQTVRFCKEHAQGAITFTKGASAAMAMLATRTLDQANDWIEFTYNRRAQRWEESGFFAV